jgi:hypothetical protein
MHKPNRRAKLIAAAAVLATALPAAAVSRKKLQLSDETAQILAAGAPEQAARARGFPVPPPPPPPPTQ